MAANPVVKKIAALLGSEAHERQIAAAIVLGELGARDAEVVDGLIAAALAGVPPVQRHAVNALQQLAGAGTAKKVLPVVLGLLGARDEAVRAAAVGAAVAFGDAAVDPVRARLGAATEPALRRALDEILARVGGKDAFTALLAALDTPDVEAAKAAALAARKRIKDAAAREKAAYFAQISGIADIVGVARPTIVPRWSCLIIEPHVDRILEKLHLLPEDLRDPHHVEARVARERLPAAVLEELETTRAALDERLDSLAAALSAEEGQPIVPPAVTGGLRANLMRRLDRFERRIISASKKQHAETMVEIATARGSLYPLGKPQERSLNFVPLLARYGPALRQDMLEEAKRHAGRLLGGDSALATREEVVSARGQL